MISGYVVGIFLVALTGGVAVWIFLTMVGVPFAPLLGFWAGLSSLIPLVGATIGGIPYIVVAFFQGWPIGVAAIVFLIVYQQIENNVFQPVIHRYTVHLNPFWIILAVLVGATMLGFIGALMAIPIAGIVQVVLQECGRGGRSSGRPSSCHRASSRPRSRRRPRPSPDEGRRGLASRRGPAKRRAARAAGRPRAAGGLTAFAGGRELALALTPSAEPGEVAGRAGRDRGGAAPARPGRRRSGRRLRPAAGDRRRGARRGARGRGAGRGARHRPHLARGARGGRGHGEEAPRLAAALAAPDVGAARRVEAALERALDPRGGLLDTASPELASVRRRLAAARRAAAELLRALAARLRSHLQESFTTERGGRPVLAVKASSRSAVPGIVHDSSGSGQTLFVEPMELVEANNRVRELAAEEAEEEARILRALSRLVGDERVPLDDLTAALAAFDLALARAALSRAWHGCRVEPAAEVELRAARHPLLDPAAAVPIDLPLEGVRALVVSGPNTGGKTVALKTLGLLAMLHQCGLRVPAARARLPVFDRVLADIGDDQSIAESLSTFSAHVRRLMAILAAAGPRSLVLLDEPAAGTDPDEGARLAEAVIERLVAQGALVLATTHHPEVKGWASAAPRAANAAVGLDARTLRPLYALQIGEPGASHALGIAEGLGLDPGWSRPPAPPDRPSGGRWRRCCRRRRPPGRRPTTSAPRRRPSAPRRRRPAAAPRPARPSSSGASPARARPRRRARRARREAQAELASLSRELADLRAEISAARREEAARRAAATAPAAPRERVRDRRLEAASRAAARAREELARRGGAAGRPGAGGRGRRCRRPGDGVPRAVVSRSTAGGPRCRVGEPGCGCRSRAWCATRPPRPPAAEPERPPVTAPPPSGPAATLEVDVRGRRAADAVGTVRERMDAAAMAGLPQVRVIHGHGTGALRAAVREELARHPLVERAEPAPPEEGGDGATIAYLG